MPSDRQLHKMAGRRRGQPEEGGCRPGANLIERCTSLPGYSISVPPDPESYS
jgi:hypothetical protein